MLDSILPPDETLVWRLAAIFEAYVCRYVHARAQGLVAPFYSFFGRFIQYYFLVIRYCTTHSSCTTCTSCPCRPACHCRCGIPCLCLSVRASFATYSWFSSRLHVLQSRSSTFPFSGSVLVGPISTCLSVRVHSVAFITALSFHTESAAAC